MKLGYLILLANVGCLLITGCAKKKFNSSLAHNYYQQSVEVSEKNKREALVLIDKSIDLDPAPKAYALKATLLYQINSYQESLKLFEKVLNDRHAPATLKTDISNNYACNLLALGKTEQAQKIWLELTENRFYLSPEVAWFNLGLLEYGTVPPNQNLNSQETARLEKAIAYFKKAIHTNQDYIDAYFILSLALVRLNRLDDAKHQLIQLIGIMPDHDNAKELIKKIDLLKKQQPKNKRQSRA